MTIAPPFTSADLEVALAAVIRGDVVTPHDPSYPAACFGYVSQGEGAPEIVVIAAEAGDVAAAVRVAARSGRRVALQGTGHTAPAAGAPTILVVTRLLARVSIDPAARTARVGAGSSWRQVLAATGPFGLVPVPSPVGHTDRRSRVRAFTFAPDHVREFEVVTSAGAILRVDADGDPERFHGLRAGRTAFGLVTAMTIDLQPAQGHHAVELWFAAADAGPVLRRWRTWIADLPPTCSTSITRLRVPDSALVPEQVRGRHLLLVRFAFPGDRAEGSRLLAPLRSSARLLLESAGNRLECNGSGRAHRTRVVRATERGARAGRGGPVEPPPGTDRRVEGASAPAGRLRLTAVLAVNDDFQFRRTA